MKTSTVIILFLFFPLFLLDQNFTSPDTLFKFKSGITAENKHLLYNYRLPDWGYSKALIEFELRGSGYHYNEYVNLSTVNENYSYLLLPSYSRYYEGEKKIYFQYAELSNDYSYEQRKDKTPLTRIITDKRKELRLSLGNSIKSYLNKSLYTHLKSDNYFDYYDSKYSVQQGSSNSTATMVFKNNSFSRRYNTRLNLGIGLGRLRNITPIITALRFNERLTLLTGKNHLDEADIMALSELFTKANGFYSTYDRSQKYFYAMLPDSVKNTLKNLSPWQFLYLTEVTQEIIGDRRQGFDSNLGLNVEYFKNIPGQGISGQEQFLLGVSTNETYYHNPTLNYQIGVQLNGSFRKALNKNTMTDYVGDLRFEVVNLWSVIDRILLEFNLSIESLFGQSDFASNLPYKNWARLDKYMAEITLDYFVENYLSIYSTAGLIYRYNFSDNLLLYNYSDFYNTAGYKDGKSWNFRVGMRYYLDRRMR